MPKTPPDNKLPREELEKLCRGLADDLKESLPDGVGFTLLLFDFGEEGNAAYVSTARRDDSVRALREMLRYLESKLTGTS